MKEVLVLYNVYSRVVKTTGSDLSCLKADIWSTFSDVLPPKASILLKIKDESWGGDVH